MTKTVILLKALPAAAAALLSLSACHQAGPRPGSVIVPSVPGEPAPAAAPAVLSGQLTSSQPQPRVTIDPRDTVLQVISASLKPGPGEEQVIAVKRMSEIDSPVRLIAVDLDPERGMYYFESWESPTNATDNRVFSLSVRDLTGEHDVQLVASGRNRDGKLTLDVFRRTTEARGNELTYRPICEIVADDIRIQDVERPDSYASDTKNGQSAQIEAYVRDPDSQKVTDLLKITYQWSASEKRYVPGPPEKVPGGQGSQEQLAKLFNNPSPDSFEDFLSGSWLMVVDDPSGRGRDSRYPSIISFDPRSRKIALSYGDTQEIYQWRDSMRSLYNRVYLIGDNDTVPQIGRTFAVTALTPTSVSISMQGNDAGDLPAVTYTKIGEDLQARLLSREAAAQPAPPVSLSGTYHAANGLSVDFRSPRLLWRSGGTQKSAVYVIFALHGRNVLSARFINADGSGGQDRSWLVDFKETKDPASIVRTLMLSPVQLTVRGYEDAAGDTLSLQQSMDLRPK